MATQAWTMPHTGLPAAVCVKVVGSRGGLILGHTARLSAAAKRRNVKKSKRPDRGRAGAVLTLA